MNPLVLLFIVGGGVLLVARAEANRKNLPQLLANNAAAQGSNQPVETATAIAGAAAALLGAVGSIFQGKQASSPSGNASLPTGSWDAYGNFQLSDAAATFQFGQ